MILELVGALAGVAAQARPPLRAGLEPLGFHTVVSHRVR